MESFYPRPPELVERQGDRGELRSRDFCDPGVVNGDQRDLRRNSKTHRQCLLQGPEAGVEVRHDNTRRRLGNREKLPEPAATVVGGITDISNECRIESETGVLQCLSNTSLSAVGRATAESSRDHSDAPVPEVEQVLRGDAASGLVIDDDRPDSPRVLSMEKNRGSRGLGKESKALFIDHVARMDKHPVDSRALNHPGDEWSTGLHALRMTQNHRQVSGVRGIFDSAQQLGEDHIGEVGQHERDSSRSGESQ